ncbi:MAG: yabD [Parachlamydiales bacterium]|nr:yabD [Parachlamydiales bacterium]
MLTDSHAHLTSRDMLAQLPSILERAEAAQIGRIINICTDVQSLEDGIDLHERYPWIDNAGATTPHDVDRDGDKAFAAFAEAARRGQLVAIGETGLEYFHKHSKKEIQQEFLIRYLHLASECRLPVIFHCRDAFDDLFAIADREYPKGLPALMHCFTGGLENAKRAVERGWMISFSGILTYKNSPALREVARWVPLEFLLIETDTPYLAPLSKRGHPNEPAYLVETARCLATIKEMPLDQMAQITTDNAQRMFRLRG